MVWLVGQKPTPRGDCKQSCAERVCLAEYTFLRAQSALVWSNGTWCFYLLNCVVFTFSLARNPKECGLICALHLPHTNPSVELYHSAGTNTLHANAIVDRISAAQQSSGELLLHERADILSAGRGSGRKKEKNICSKSTSVTPTFILWQQVCSHYCMEIQRTSRPANLAGAGTSLPFLHN